MNKYSLDENRFIQSKDRKLENFQFYYGSEYRDKEMFRYAYNLPRFGHLGRKLLRHYLGDRYNPHTIFCYKEAFIRLCIKQIIEYKISNRLKGYDWDWIDHFFKMTLTNEFGVPFPYDMDRLERGPDAPFRAPDTPGIDPDIDH